MIKPTLLHVLFYARGMVNTFLLSPGDRRVVNCARHKDNECQKVAQEKHVLPSNQPTATLENFRRSRCAGPTCLIKLCLMQYASAESLSQVEGLSPDLLITSLPPLLCYLMESFHWLHIPSVRNKAK